MTQATCITPTPPYRALIFDCDGTLANTLPVHFQTWSTSLESFGVELTKEWYYQHCGLSAVEMLQELNTVFGYELDTATVNARRQQHYRSLIHKVEEIRAVGEIVRAEYGKVPMAVASGGERSIVEATLDTIGLREFFTTIVTVDDVTRGKPAPDIFLLAAERLEVPPSECIVYEDSDGGLEAARRSGMRSIDVRHLNSLLIV
jgi:beta-phosphoglucomutase family hydrolase